MHLSIHTDLSLEHTAIRPNYIGGVTHTSIHEHISEIRWYVYFWIPVKNNCNKRVIM